LPAAFVFDSAPFPSCHGATIVETRPGQFLAAWFGGTREGATDVAIWLSRYAGQRSAPEKVAEEKGQPCWNPVLFKERRTGEVTLFYKAGPSPQQWSGFYRRSTDGATFGDSYILPAGLLGPIKNKPIQLADQTILAPTSVESFKAWACWVERSVDGGRNWTKHGPIFHPQKPLGVIQPSILVRPDGSLFMIMRSTKEIGQICSAESKDGGVTWSPAQPIQDLPNPNSGIDAVTLADGRHVLVYNPTHQGRTPLVVSVASPDGKTWKQAVTLESEPGEYSYPAVIQASDGSIQVVYTWRRQKIRHWRIELKELGA
jgi:predicted neuraminidase